MVIVTQGYGYGYDPAASLANLICKTGGAVKTCPNFNYELYIDGEEYKNFHNFSLNQTISTLATFNITVGNPQGMNTNIFRPNAEVEFKASWGNRAPTTVIKGLIKTRGFQSSMQRLISLSGIDYGDYLNRRRGWDASYNPIPFNNETTHTIAERLISMVPELKLQMNRKNPDPRLSFTTDPTQNLLLNELKAVLEYSDYHWYINNDRIMVFEPRPLEQASSKFNLIFANIEDSPSLPELPNVILHSAKVDEDYGSIRNFYKVTGKDNIFAIADDPVSIQRYRGKFEGYYSDNRLTSTQSCYLAARQMAATNGYPKQSISCSFKGTTDLHVGDVVFVGDAYSGFSMLDNPFLHVVGLRHTYANTWITTAQLGSLEPSLMDLLLGSL